MTWIIKAALALLLAGCATCAIEPDIEEDGTIWFQIHCPF